MAWADAGGVKAAPRRVVAYVIRALATHGHRRRHAARGSCRWSATDNVAQFVSVNHTGLTTHVHVEQTLNPWTSRQNFLNQNCRPMYQLQYLFKALVLIRNRNREKSCSRLACQAVRVPDLAKFAKC